MDILQFLRSLKAGGINSLEWTGIVCSISFVAYFLFNLRDGVSGNVNSRSTRTKKKKNKKNLKPDKQIIKSLPQGEETVLIVDDDPAVLRAHTRLISKLGYNTQRALGGQEAIDFVRENQADLIVLDLLMPGLDGIETFRCIKEFKPDQKAIVLSGFAGPSMVNSIKRLGVNTYLVKPAEISILAKAIRDEIDRP